jgi:Ser/Thr protein kinase RdoA (MazF antagonist)
MSEHSSHPFSRLTPDFIMDAVESLGYRCDYRILTLNSYENRVYQVGIDEAEPLIAKFYRPERWSREQILEEHDFTAELAAHELPVVAPLRHDNGETLHSFKDFHFSLSPRKGGHSPELDNDEHLQILGRLLGRIHATGSQRPFAHRPTLNIDYCFSAADSALMLERFIPVDYHQAYTTLTRDLLQLIGQRYDEIGAIRNIRCHGDCHNGNMLWRDTAPHFVDFDDALMAPAMQDLWMLLSGDNDQQQHQLDKVLSGYLQFFDFDPRELRLIEPLRSLRILKHSAWLAKRWDDPAFKRTFSWFDSPQYWGEHILELREQLSALQEPPLQL